MGTVSALQIDPTLLTDEPLSADELRKMDAYWRACNYCCVGMLYLRANPLLREPLKVEHIKNRLLGHWGSDPGQTFTWVHLNRLIKKYALDLIYISGPGHGAPATLSNSYLEGVYSEVYPDKSEDVVGMQRFFRSEVCAGFDLYFRAGTWGAGDAVEQLSGGRVLGGLSGQERRRGGNAAVLQAVLVSGRDWQPLHAGDAGVDPRRRRVGLQPVAWVWRGVRQSGPDCCGGGGRRRVGDRAAGDKLAWEQVFEPGARWGGAADPAPEWLQDREPHDPGANSAGRAGDADARTGMDALRGGGRRSGGDAPEDGCGDGEVRAGDSRDPAGGAGESDRK